MTKSYLLDTNICIAILKRRPAQAKRMLNANASSVYVSSLTVAELHYGVQNSAPDRRNENMGVVTDLLARLPVLDFTNDHAIEYGRVRDELERDRLPIGSMDTLIAAQARAENMVMVTNNVGEFQRVNGLEIEDWLSLP